MTPTLSPLDPHAEQYVRLVLSLGLHDADYVDAFYGPAQWQAAIAAEHPSLPDITVRAQALLESLRGVSPAGQDAMSVLRLQYLMRQVSALISRAQQLQGAHYAFDEEALALYDVTPPTYQEEHFARVVEEIGGLLPGSGTVQERFEEFKHDFVIPPDRVGRVFDAAIDEGRSRSAAHLTLPPGETFSVEFVTGKPWSGYNWYKGNATSVIQVNVDFPITIDRAVDLACHEGYPGHHVYNSMLERELAQARGWKEFTVYALFSPQSLIAEGTANFGIEMAFPGQERVAFERDVVFPLAGIDPGHAGYYYRVHALVQRLAYAGNEAARRYLEGSITRTEAAGWLEQYALMSPDRAMQRTHFFDKYRSYVINYNLGQDLVQRSIERQGGTPGNPERRWKLFAALLSSPRIPSAL
jgi:hypothetical protein